MSLVGSVKLILVIDDDPDVLRLLENQLGRLGHRVVTSSSSERGLEIAQTGNPDLIILDIMMPVLDGIEVLRRLRGDPITELTPVVIITAETQRARVTEAMRVGVDDYLLKPYTLEQLTEKLESAFSWNVFHQIHTDEDKTLHVDRQQGLTVVSFLEALTATATREAFEALLTPEFRGELQSHVLVLDLRILPGMEANEVPVLMEFLSRLAPTVAHVVAGRNFGLLLDAFLELGESARLYLSFGDLTLALKAPGPG